MGPRVASLSSRAPLAAAPASCTIASTAMTFPQYNPLANLASTFSGSLSLTNCVAVDLSVALGTGGANSFAPRKMFSGSATIAYNLYQDSGFTTVWGDGSGVTKPVTFTVVLGSQTIPIYGNVPGAQIVPAGTYTDSVTVTLSTL